MAERTCPNCGETVPDANYCAECGESLPEAGGEGEAPAAETSPESPSEGEGMSVPPPPPEEPPVDESPGEVAGAEQSGADRPPVKPPQEREPFAPPSAPEPQESPEDEPVTPESLKPRGEHQEPVVSGATPMQQAAEDARAPAPPVDGQLRCPDCGEAVYGGDRMCWSCSRRLERPEQPPPQREPQQPGTPESGAPTVPQAEQRPAQPPRQQSPQAPAQPQAPAAEQPSSEAMSYAWWSFGLGLLSVFTCGVLGLLGIASLWLGISAARRDGGPVAIAGAVFGAIGLLMLLAWVVALAIAMPEMMGPGGPTHIFISPFK